MLTIKRINNILFNPGAMATYIVLLVIISAFSFISYLTYLYQQEERHAISNFNSYLNKHHCSRTGFMPDIKGPVPVYQCDNGLLLYNEINDLANKKNADKVLRKIME